MNSRRPNRQPQRLILPRWALSVLPVGLLVLLLGGAWLAFGGKGQSQNGDASLTPVAQPTTGLPAVPRIGGYEVWRGSERITILLLGVDARESEIGPWRTDTIILLTLDPQTHTGGMLSIPRDLWVDIPGVGPDRINTASLHGGPDLTVVTVEKTFGIGLDHYVMINFDVFVTVVDGLGCISLDVPVDITDPYYPDAAYGYDPFYMEAGLHEQVCGEEALKYARTRATFGSDFDRGARQQQVIHAVRDRALQPGNLLPLLGNAPQLWDAVQEDMTTDMTLDQAIGLALLALDVPEENIRSEVLDTRFTTDSTIDGQMVLLPIPGEIIELVGELFPAEN